MDLFQLAENLQNLLQAGNWIFLKSSPEIIDFSDLQCRFKLHFWSKDYQFDLEMPHKELLVVIAILAQSIFNSPKLTIIGWNIKNLFSFVRSITRDDLKCSCQLLDLKILERYCGEEQLAPNSFLEAAKRIKQISGNEKWDSLKEVYKKIYLPLVTKVIPRLETEGVIDSEKRLTKYSYYEIAGPKSGRLSCQKALKDCFNPHSIIPVEREVFRPSCPNSVFLYLDYRHMEVNMLHWLTKDENLGKLLRAEDFYVNLFRVLLKTDSATDKQRTFCKNLFIPMIYGQLSPQMAENLKISEQAASKLIDRLYTLFPIALRWLDDNAALECSDYFGRKRRFEKAYQARNFLIQSPASMVCLEKLICLQEGLGSDEALVCSIHDGYVLRAEQQKSKTLAYAAKEILESESVICPGLKLRTSCKIGKSLSSWENLE